MASQVTYDMSGKAVLIIGVVGGKTEEVGDFGEDLQVPVVEPPGDPLPVGVIGIDDRPDPPAS